MRKALKKWIHRALHSKLKGGLHEKKHQGNIVNRIGNILLLGIQNVRPLKMCNLLKPIKKSDKLRMMGCLICIPSLIMGAWMVLCLMLGISNVNIRALLIWLFIFLLFSLQGFVLIIFEYRDEKRKKS